MQQHENLVGNASYEYQNALAALDLKRESVFRNEALSDEERIDEMQEIDHWKAITELNYIHNTDTFRSQEETEGKQALLEIASSDFYTILPETNVYERIPGKSPEEEHAFRLTYEGHTVLPDGKIRFAIRAFEPYDKEVFHVEHAGVIEVDLINRTVHSILSPEGIAIERPRMLLPKNNNTHALEQAAIAALGKLLRPTDQIPSSYKGGESLRTEDGDGVSAEERYTPLERERESMLKCRKRTIHPEHVGTVTERISSLVDHWSDEEREILLAEGDGVVRLHVFLRKINGGFVELEEKYAENEISSLQATLEQEFSTGQYADATITCVGAWVERYLRGLEPAPSPSAHTRRLRGKVVLVLPKEADSKLRNIQQKILAGGVGILDDEEIEALSQTLATDKEGLLEIFARDGISYKSGDFSTGNTVGNATRPNAYTYTESRQGMQ